MCSIVKKALVVIDMQNDYLWEKRKKKFTYDTEELVAKKQKQTPHTRAVVCGEGLFEYVG